MDIPAISPGHQPGLQRLAPPLTHQPGTRGRPAQVGWPSSGPQPAHNHGQSGGGSQACSRVVLGTPVWPERANTHYARRKSHEMRPVCSRMLGFGTLGPLFLEFLPHARQHFQHPALSQLEGLQSWASGQPQNKLQGHTMAHRWS